ENILNAYRTGRGSIRVRARWQIEELPRGQWQIIVTEIPYQVAKSKLIEKIAELIQLKKIPILGDVRDESAEDIRLVLEPRSKTVDPIVLMETLFRQSDLETRFSMNMNVLIDGLTPKVCSMKEVLRAFLDHRRDVLIRRSQHRLEKIDHRLEVLEGYIVAFLNLDRVIEIIRNEDHPKPIMMAEFDLTDVQAEAILNMRLRSLRRLEEMELKREHEELLIERAALEDLLADESLQWAKISEQLRETRKKFGKTAPGGARRSELADAPEFEEVPLEAMIEKEPITIVCSTMGWIRAMKGHIALDTELKFKDGDEGRFVFHGQTTDKLVLFGSNGRFYTLGAANLPGGRGMGEPVRLIVDLPNEASIVDLFLHQPDRRLLVASTAGDGFVVPEAEVIAQTKSGRQVLNVKGKDVAKICKAVRGDHVAIVSENGKFLVFAVAELPEMTRGKGVRLQKYKSALSAQGTLDLDGGLADITTFNWADGLSWPMGGDKTRHQADLTEWLGKRAGVGKRAPYGFPRNNKFS
ncbi:MAG: topoisomerase-4 subunit A, partial [Candidatus Paceibacteria bacterium]